jgi:uncharacterized protein YjlB
MPDPRALAFADDGSIPNNPLLPALVYTGVEAAAAGADACVELFASHGWTGAWRDGLIFPFHHFHSTAHEVLGIVSGATRVKLGGEAGEELEVRAGDVLVLPAGTGHKRLGGTDGLAVVGAYADGREWDLLRGDPAEHDGAVARIAAVPVPAADPVTGEPIWVRLTRRTPSGSGRRPSS